MPRSDDIDSVLILGPGPVLIGQGCEFDYSSVQACLALKEEGIRTIGVSSNSASLMTDPALCDATYVEPMTEAYVEKIIEKERPKALYASVGGQRALSVAISLHEKGVLQRYGVEVIGPRLDAVVRGENRDLFYRCMQKEGLPVAPHCFVRTVAELSLALETLSFPLLVRRGFCLGGDGSCFVSTEQQLRHICSSAFANDEGLMLDTSLIGWKEFEIEVLVDESGCSVAVCGIENIDPMGIHTGDSIAVTPVLTLTDTEYQTMRQMAFACVKAIGFYSGGANVQFAMHPIERRIVIVEMNPRMSRSSALASKATGYSIAKVATRLALGYHLREIMGGLLTHELPASFEPALDFVAVKIPKFQFEKFPSFADTLGTKMQAVGEVMAVGSNFTEALYKAMQGVDRPVEPSLSLAPSSDRLFSLLSLLRLKTPISALHKSTGIDMWFLEQMAQLIYEKPSGHLSYRFMDSTAAEKSSLPRVIYSTSFGGDEISALSDKSIIVIGSGASRIGQGIEFDALSAQALSALRHRELPAIMINDNPSAVSTDPSFSDRLYISPLTLDYVKDICRKEKPLGVIVTFGGQTALSLAEGLEKEGVPLLGISAEKIMLCEDRRAFRQWIDRLGISQPCGITLGPLQPIPSLRYPVIVRPSFVLGGRGMRIVKNEEELHHHLVTLRAAELSFPVLVEEFLQDAIEVDVDVITDGSFVYIPALQEHLEPAGIHSGDSMHYVPPRRLSQKIQKQIYSVCKKVALSLQIKGMINIQLAMRGASIYVIEVNPRAARTVPFLSKILRQDVVDLAIHVMLGGSLSSIEQKKITSFFVKRPIFSTHVFAGIHLGPEMLSTGEVMGWGQSYEIALEKVGALKEGHIHPVQSLQMIE